MATLPKTIKIVVVGDDYVGKTSMLFSYVTDRFPEHHPTVFDSWSGTRIYNEEVYSYLPFDTAGSSDYDHLRPLAYPQTDVFLVCFSVDSVSSYDNVRLKWFPELRYYGPHVPIVLSAMKIDLRGDERVDGALAKNHERPISREQGQRLSEELGAAEYGECSSLTQEGLLELWDKIFRAALQGLAQQSPQTKTRRCLIL